MPHWVFPAVIAGFAVVVFFSFLRCWRRCACRKNSSATSVALHSEHAASGYSHRSFLTKLGGIARKVEITVTNNDLLVDVAYPFALVAEQVDLCHRIALSSIEGVAARRVEHGLECIITFRNGHGIQQQLSVFPEAPDRFLQALHTPVPELAA